MLRGAVASVILAAIIAILVGFGIWHARRTSDEETLFVGKTAPAAS